MSYDNYNFDEKIALPKPLETKFGNDFATPSKQTNKQ